MTLKELQIHHVLALFKDVTTNYTVMCPKDEYCAGINLNWPIEHKKAEV